MGDARSSGGTVSGMSSCCCWCVCMCVLRDTETQTEGGTSTSVITQSGRRLRHLFSPGTNDEVSSAAQSKNEVPRQALETQSRTRPSPGPEGPTAWLRPHYVRTGRPLGTQEYRREQNTKISAFMANRSQRLWSIYCILSTILSPLQD